MTMLLYQDLRLILDLGLLDGVRPWTTANKRRCVRPSRQRYGIFDLDKVTKYTDVTWLMVGHRFLVARYGCAT
jgi:hypothetical protein